ncbi:dihydrofolate reductase family protein [Methylobacter sp.]|uniref:RibD family protein n=1 Tax=Methylobacter sp. TaxID=2051955 RepID=UPI00122549CD|nr:dihydrofolate reductase family protein [Methylobacter sp.]TAK59983.1 MAG: riboflavin biosynthesis protein RibD [Methylobacter sp.]
MSIHKNLLRFYPHPCKEVPLQDLYLDHDLHKQGTTGSPCVYANFLSSLDGRIALEDSAQRTYIPKHITTDSDFGLFMELHAQADCIITHGGYMRALGEGRLGNILQVKDKHLAEWRRNNGLQAQPAVIIASASLDFPIHNSLHKHAQTVYIATGKNADPNRIRYWQDLGYPMLFTGEDHTVHGAPLIHQLSGLGYKSIYLVAGPQMLDTVIREKQLSRLYLTITHQLIGGKDFRTLLTGSTLGPEGNLILEAQYYEQDSPPGSGQFFMQFGLGRPNNAELGATI